MPVTSPELIEAFVNTLHKHSGRPDEDLLATPSGLTAWLKQHELLGEGSAGSDDLRRVRELREALRSLLLAHNGVELEQQPAWEIVDAVARRARLELRFRTGAPELVAVTRGLDAALGEIARAVNDAIIDGSWLRLKACRAPDCEWAFLDTAKNQSRAWCSMSSCGNREKARAFRQRRVTPAGPDARPA